jgi:hypothetical protein
MRVFRIGSLWMLLAAMLLAGWRGAARHIAAEIAKSY